MTTTMYYQDEEYEVQDLSSTEEGQHSVKIEEITVPSEAEATFSVGEKVHKVERDEGDGKFKKLTE